VLIEREIRQNIMTDDRESANPRSSSSEDSLNDPLQGASGGASPVDRDTPHPFDRPSSDAQFDGPSSSASSSASSGPAGGPTGGPSSHPFGHDSPGNRDRRAGSEFGGSGFAGGSISSLQDLISLARMGGGLPKEMARSWVRENQTSAMIGAFAVGVFIGAITRD